MENFVDYELLAAQLSAVTEGVPYEVANLSNASALLWEHLLPVSGSPSAGVSAAPQWRKTRRSWLPMYISSPVILPATARPIPKSCCPSM